MQDRVGHHCTRICRSAWQIDALKCARGWTFFSACSMTPLPRGCFDIYVCARMRYRIVGVKKKKRRRVAFCSLPIFEGDRLWCCFCVSCFLKPCGTCAGKLWRGNSALWNPDIQTSHWLYDMSFFFKCPTPLEALCCCWHCNDDRCCLAFAVCMAKGGLAVMGMSQLCPCGVLRYFFRGICQVLCKKYG